MKCYVLVVGIESLLNSFRMALGKSGRNDSNISALGYRQRFLRLGHCWLPDGHEAGGGACRERGFLKFSC